MSRHQTTDKEYGIRWSVIGRNDRVSNKEKWFKSSEARAKFAIKVSDADNFYEINSFCDPKTEQ